MLTLMHPWELRGIGKAPYGLVDLYSIPRAESAATRPPAGFGCGICGVCSTPLIHNFLIRAACGSTFSVGCDCVKKTNDKKLIDLVASKKRQKAAEARTAKRQAEFAARLRVERCKNKGLTDFEVREKVEAKRQAARVAIVKKLISAEIEILRAQFTDFCKSIASDLDRAYLPTGRGLAIAIGIIAKYQAIGVTDKTRGKAYEAEYEEQYNAIGKKFDKLKTKLAQ
jgi:hypothetical protein